MIASVSEVCPIHAAAQSVSLLGPSTDVPLHMQKAITVSQSAIYLKENNFISPIEVQAQVSLSNPLYPLSINILQFQLSS